MNVDVIRATAHELDELAELFDGYRVFYKQQSDKARARSFLAERLQRDESVVFLARLSNGTAAGFTQLFPTFSSVSTQRLWVLNDLFVSPDARRHGVGGALMDRAEHFAREDGAKGVVLETAIDNVPAQRLYEARGWVRESHFYRYELVF